MISIKKYKNTLLSIVFIVSALVLFYLQFTSGNYFQSLYIVYLIPILNVLGVFFAFLCMRLKQLLWINASIAVIGTLTLIAILFLDFWTLIAVNLCGRGPC